jgi:SOS-response transcriptional repressor LexA
MHSRFPVGTVFIIDPKEKPIDGDLVLIRFKNNESVSLRDLIIDSPHWQLLSIAQNAPSINYDVKEHEIIGVVLLTILNARKS